MVFTVVLYENESLEVVPSNWLNDDNTLVFYPHWESEMLYKVAKQQRMDPTIEDWLQYNIKKVIGKHGNNKKYYSLKNFNNILYY